MKKTALFTALLCAAALTACGNTAANDSTLKIEVQTSTTASATVTASAETTTTTASAVTAASAQTSTAASETTTAAKSESTAASSVQTTVSETESTQPAETETAPQSTDAPAETTTVKETTTAAKQLRLFADLNVGDDATAYIQQNSCVPDEATSCHGEGKDRVYQYSSYTLNTFFNGKTDKVFEIVVTAPGIKVEDVLEIGMKKADVIAKIGEGEDDIYHRDKYDLSILYDDDEKVSEISLIDPEA